MSELLTAKVHVGSGVLVAVSGKTGKWGHNPPPSTERGKRRNRYGKYQERMAARQAAKVAA